MLMSIIAFSIVFLVIIGLMLLMMCLKYFVGMMKQEKADAPKETPLSPAAPVTAVPTAVNASFADDELTAVITAAITAATGVAAKVLSFAPSRPGETGSGHATPAWRMTSILSNSRGLRD